MVADIRSGVASSDPRYLTNVKGNVFFRASDGTSGQELWRSTGSAAGTVLVKDMNPGAAGSYPESLTNLSGTLMFSAYEPAAGIELYRSNGSTSGTFRLADLRPGPTGSGPRDLVMHEGFLYFSANDGVNGRELFRSGIFASSLIGLGDLRPGPLGSNPNDLTSGGTYLTFAGNDGLHGTEVWSLHNPASAALLGTSEVKSALLNGGGIAVAEPIMDSSKLEKSRSILSWTQVTDRHGRLRPNACSRLLCEAQMQPEIDCLLAQVDWQDFLVELLVDG
jgi:ELWxxDGT repeat protein